MSPVAHPPAKGYRTIRLPLAEAEYERFLTDGPYAKERLQDLQALSPELFPQAFCRGYAFYGFPPPSRKQQLRCRRVRGQETHEVFTLTPAFVLPYMSGRVAEVDNALFLMRFHVPCWAIAQVFGRDARYWYRLPQGLGRFSVVGTTVKTAAHLPPDLVADEKHSWLKGERVYLATTVARDCLLGAAVAPTASQADLQAAYSCFAQEAAALDQDYAPHTVNTDGWAATQGAWRALFPKVTVLWCFLHAFLKIRDRATKALRPAFEQVQEPVGGAYQELLSGSCRAVSPCQNRGKRQLAA